LKVASVLVGDDLEAVWDVTESVVEPTYLVKLGCAGLSAPWAPEALDPCEFGSHGDSMRANLPQRWSKQTTIKIKLGHCEGGFFLRNAVSGRASRPRGPYSGGLSSPLIQLSAAFTGSSASHFSQVKIVPTKVGWRFNGPAHLGHLSAGSRRGIPVE
jgi:hypothetical protein